MLIEIHINNFVLIDELRIQFSRGMNVLSGEAGAGKSIIIDALGLLMGDRISNDFIRNINHQTLVEGVFDVSSNPDARIFLSKQGLVADDDDEIDTVILSREINPGGKSVGRLNGRYVTLATLRGLSIYLVDMHLQDDRQSILRPANYVGYVDGFAADTDNLREEVASLFTACTAAKKQLEDMRLNNQNRIQRLDFLNYQIKEIEDSKLREGEEEELSQLRERIKNAGALLEGSARIIEKLYNSEKTPSAYDQIASALDIAFGLDKDMFFAQLVEPLENIFYSIEEISSNIVEFKEGLEFEPGHLEDIENRLYLISKLKGKYGATIKDILNYLVQARQERNELEEIEERQDDILENLERLQSQYMVRTTELTRKREAAALLLEKKIKAEMLELSMPNINFRILLDKKETPGIDGMDHVEFLFSPNPGEEMKPIRRIASGGEISRFILALKTALSEVYKIPTLIFDEIDVGLGGSALNAVARKLNELSRSHQLILVTHSPQIASYGILNFVIEKHVIDNKTYTRVKKLAEEEKVAEIARMLDGEDYSPLTEEHAREMIAMAEKQD